MGLDLGDAHGLEGAVAHVQRDLDAFDAGGRHVIEDRLGEVQAGRRRGHGPALAGEHGLVPLAVRVEIRPLDVGRQRHMADGVDEIHHRPCLIGPQAYQAPAEEPLLEHLAAERVAAALEAQAASRLQPLPGVHQRLPVLIVHARDEQAFDLAATRLARAEQARREHLRVVQDEDVAPREASTGGRGYGRG